MTSDEEKSLSKYLSLVLRHDPAAADATLDAQGWVRVEALIAGAARKGRVFTADQLRQVVANSDKQRFALSADGQSVRANQGHSVAVDLGLKRATPPETLYHGTSAKTASSILVHGLSPMDRQHVHLSADPATAQTVGARHGKPVVFTVYARTAHDEGQPFWLSDNGVWLTQALDAEFLYLPPVRGAE